MKKYMTIAALLAAGTVFSNAVALTDADSILANPTSMTSDDGTFSVVLALDVDTLRSYLETGATAEKHTLISYDANSNLTGITTNYSSSGGKIVSSALYGIWQTNYAWNGTKFSSDDLTAIDWDSVTGAGLTYTFDHSNGTSVAFVLEAADGTLLENSYVSAGGLKVSAAGASEITFDSAVTSAYYFNEALSETDAKTLAASAAAIPEPSAFGLLAGVGALALVAARRRRRSK